MKKKLPPAPSIMGRACAGFSYAGFWRENKPSLLLAMVAAAAVIVLLIWLTRRRQNNQPESLPEPGPDLGMTQVEGQPETAKPKPAFSPGLHGKIEVFVGDQPISTYLVTDNPLPIGRDPGQALVIIQEPIVSKLHCQVFARNGEVFVKDLHSTNGVYVNEEKVLERLIQDGDAIFLGKKGTVRIIYHA